MSNKITVKTTTTITADLGNVPSGMVKDLLVEGGDGTNFGKGEDRWSIFDLGGASVETTLDSVTVE